MRGGIIEVYVMSDHDIGQLRRACREEGVVLRDKRTRWKRFWYCMRSMGLVLLVIYVTIAHFHNFMQAMSCPK